MQELDKADVRELAIQFQSKQMNYLRRYSEGWAMQADPALDYRLIANLDSHNTIYSLVINR